MNFVLALVGALFFLICLRQSSVRFHVLERRTRASR